MFPCVYVHHLLHSHVSRVAKATGGEGGAGDWHEPQVFDKVSTTCVTTARTSVAPLQLLWWRGGDSLSNASLITFTYIPYLSHRHLNPVTFCVWWSSVAFGSIRLICL